MNRTLMYTPRSFIISLPWKKQLTFNHFHLLTSWLTLKSLAKLFSIPIISSTSIYHCETPFYNECKKWDLFELFSRKTINYHLCPPYPHCQSIVTVCHVLSLYKILMFKRKWPNVWPNPWNIQHQERSLL